jgi:hypothetical protein
MKKPVIHLFSIIWAIAPVLVFAQSNVPYSKEETTKNLKQHITTLASDEFEGREAGTKGEKLAYEYIIKQYQSIGLEPKGSDAYLQPFPFTGEGQATPANTFSIGKKNFKLGDDFFPLAYSANASASGKAVNVGFGIVAPNRDDYEGIGDVKGKIVVMEYGFPDGMHPHSRMAEHADQMTRVDSAIAKGVIAVLFVNSDEDTDDPKYSYTRKITSRGIPVMFITGDAYTMLNEKEGQKVSLTTEIVREELIAYNVLGYINNEAENTVVVGAHYDHLGYGDEGSLHRGEKAIHNGADDNASGVAVMIELARILDMSDLESNNYLFIAFSGEEKGLLGSNYYVRNATVPLENTNYMMNMDMVGRIDTLEPVLIINGAGTSPAWERLLEDHKQEGLKYKTTESGIGPSDHTSFYLRDIPAIHFFSGTHGEYHKPEDDEELINYPGQLQVIDVMLSIIQDLDDEEKLAFTKTKDSDSKNAPRFKVTLGVVPDYAYSGDGMRIDGVSDDRPAQKAGMKAGDVVKKMGDQKVTDMMSYMKALSKFTKGETTTVEYERDGEIMTTEVTF